MNDLVKYQLDKAIDALRTAIKLGADNEDAYLLRNIAETINTIGGWKTSYRYSLKKENQKDGSIKFTMGHDPDYNISSYYSATAGGSGAGGVGADVITFK